MDYYWATVVISVVINNLTITAKEVLCQLLLLLLSLYIILWIEQSRVWEWIWHYKWKIAAEIHNWCILNLIFMNYEFSFIERYLNDWFLSEISLLRIINYKYITSKSFPIKLINSIKKMLKILCKFIWCGEKQEKQQQQVDRSNLNLIPIRWILFREILILLSLKNRF